MSDTSAPNPNPPPAPPAVTAEEKKAAFKAFKKKMKVTQLDEDSRYGKSPLSGGKTQIAAITPPNQYGKAVWDALVAEGKLKYAGQGMYEMVM
jgi:hypothetical protein